MQRWSRLHLDREANPDADYATVDAARATLRWVNSWLHELEPGPIESLLAMDLAVKRRWALHALFRHYGGAKGQVKREQLDATGGRALAICTGGGSRLYVQTVLGVAWTTPKGCFRIFEEAKNMSGRKWPVLCPDCQPRTGKRNPYRTARRDLQARAKQIADIHSIS
jgi:hypothetical protein